MLAQPVGWAPMLLAVYSQGLKAFPVGIGISAYLHFAGWEILVAEQAGMVKNQSWAGEAQRKRHWHAGDRNVVASFKGKSWIAWSFGEGTVLFLVVLVWHPPLVRWSVMSQYGYVGAAPRLAEGVWHTERGSSSEPAPGSLRFWLMLIPNCFVILLTFPAWSR